MKIDKQTWSYTKVFFVSFMEAKPFTYSSSIALYTIFSMPAIICLVVIISSIIFRYEGLLTSLLFFIGKYFIGFYLAQSNPVASYSATGSLVLILVWAYYSSLIPLMGGKITPCLVKLKELKDSAFSESIQINNPFNYEKAS